MKVFTKEQLIEQIEVSSEMCPRDRREGVSHRSR